MTAQLAALASAPSGTLFYAEDGVLTPINPPTVNSTLRFSAAAGLPYWDPDS